MPKARHKFKTTKTTQKSQQTHKPNSWPVTGTNRKTQNQPKVPEISVLHQTQQKSNSSYQLLKFTQTIQNLNLTQYQTPSYQNLEIQKHKQIPEPIKPANNKPDCTPNRHGSSNQRQTNNTNPKPNQGVQKSETEANANQNTKHNSNINTKQTQNTETSKMKPSNLNQADSILQ